MSVHFLKREQIIFSPIEIVWDYFSAPENLNNLTPPDMNFEILTNPLVRMFEGQLIEYRVQIFPGIRTLWLTEISHIRQLEYFVDEQRLGPYAFWYHEHKFIKINDNQTKMIDNVTYSIGYGFVGSLLNYLFIGKKLSEIFDFRSLKITELFPGQERQ
ncbi:MAG: SRPBCC family protein [Chloroflexota bacterium]